MKLPLTFTRSILALILFMFASPVALGATFLEIPGIDGEQETLGHPDLIEISSYSQGANEFSIVKPLDSTSDDLALATALGTNFPTVTALFYNGNPLTDPPDNTLVFQTVLISSYQVNPGGVSESVTFSFQSVVPEPAALSVLAVCALALRRRR